MHTISWLLFAMLPCIIQAFRPPIVVSMQPSNIAEEAPRNQKLLCPVVYVPSTFRFRRSLDVVKRGIEDEGFKFDLTACDDINDRLPVKEQVTQSGGPMEFGLGLRRNKDMGAGINAGSRPGLKYRNNYENSSSNTARSSSLDRVLTFFIRNQNNLRFGRSVDFQTFYDDFKEEDKNLYATPYSDIPEINDSKNSVHQFQSFQDSTSPSIMKRGASGSRHPVLLENQ
ncbi:uncharacterized protein [Palaemon carinicauda]|uniref:uncharacterized protein n=1 Tax=Palaemon carinicauda TaxID=392227 RepID=UPI0035B6A73A